MTSRSLLVVAALSFSLYAQNRNPVILIPGFSGSELRHKDTGERIWFKALKQRSEDLRLPISDNLAANTDSLVPGDIVRTLKLGIIPVSDIYGGMIQAFEARGYHEEKWDSPSARGADPAIYVFPYDWRMDNVGNARRLIRQVAELKAKLGRPDLKFDIVSHSMGGIIARYAVMYGDMEMTASPRPTWSGAEHFDKVILMGTPNEGSALALNSLINGFLLNGVRVDLPFLQDSSRFTAFTMPAVYQLLPAPGTLRAFDERLAPIEVDIYDPAIWKRYGWSVTDDKGFKKKFPDHGEQLSAERYFAAVLDRAKRLHQALAFPLSSDLHGVSFYVLGSDCKRASDAIVVYRDRSGKWNTLFEPDGITRSDGTRVAEAELRKIMLSKGDGIVSRRSLEASTQTSQLGSPVVAKSNDGHFVCEEHVKLPKNGRIQDHIFTVLGANKPAKADLAAARN